jgi:predicted DNA-binding antitoxin AbrB/MazE fold protein
MSQFIQAIYEHGVFRPLEPVDLAERKQVSLVVTETGTTADKPQIANDDAAIERQREALAPLRTKMDALTAALEEAENLPIEGPDDGFSGADHDLVLYGWKK